MDRHEKVKQLRIDVHQSYKIALNMFKFISYFCNNLSVQFAEDPVRVEYSGARVRWCWSSRTEEHTMEQNPAQHFKCPD